MKKMLRDMMVATAGLILLLSPLSCSLVFEEIEVTPVEREGFTMVTFEMDLPLLPSATRSPEGTYDPGNAAYENYIDYWNDLRFYIFDSTNPTTTQSPAFLGCISPDSTYVDGTQTVGTDYKRYTLRALLAKNLTEKIKEQADSKFRIVAMANCGTYPEIVNGKLKYNGTEIKTLSEMVNKMTYTMNNDLHPYPLTSLDKDHLIPMFGVTECGGVDFVAGGINDIGIIYMLRALAKVEVCVREEEYSDLRKVVLKGYNLGGLCAPRYVTKKEDYVKNDYAEDYVDRISLVNGNANETNAGTRSFDMQPTSTIEYSGVVRNVFTAYIPEYRNFTIKNEEDTVLMEDRSKLILQFDDDDTTEYPLEFKYYDSESAAAAKVKVGTHFNVKRNNYYKFKVMRKYELDVNVEVVPYIGVELKPNFGFDDFLPSIK